MKINNNMIAKDLRFIGSVYKVLLGSIPKKKSAVRKNKQVKTDKSKQFYNEYIQRPDHTHLRLLIKKPKVSLQKGPGVLWIHGGGYATGMPEMMSMSMARLISKECVIVSPDYRLSVEKPYPAALEDCYQALLWMTEHAKELGIRDDQIFVGGESAGGGLTVALCLYARDKGNVNIACQMPLYPMIDDRMQTWSMKDNNAPVWNERQNKAAWRLYLDGCDKENIPKYAAPARESDYNGLPPAITFVGSIEPFCEETVQYVKDLEKSGVQVEFEIFDGCFHAFDMLAPWSKSAKKAAAFFMDCFRTACKNYYAPQKVERK
jgi:acetyl esterase/lipase